MNQGHLNIRDVEIFVLDEADRMLDMGFIHDVKKILAAFLKKDNHFSFLQQCCLQL
jgi:ATP-dependent RNA helicase RhlE